MVTEYPCLHLLAIFMQIFRKCNPKSSEDSVRNKQYLCLRNGFWRPSWIFLTISQGNKNSYIGRGHETDPTIGLLCWMRLPDDNYF